MQRFTEAGKPLPPLNKSQISPNSLTPSISSTFLSDALTGLTVAISELDIRIKLQGRSESQIAQDRLQQTKDFEAAFEVCAGVTKCVGVTLWGVSDNYSWIPTNPGTKGKQQQKKH